MLTSWSGGVDPAELSIASVLQRTPACAASMRPSWVKPRLPPRRPPGSAARLAPLMRIASLARSPTSAWRLAARLDVGADAAVEQVHRRRRMATADVGRHAARPRCPSTARCTCGDSGSTFRATRRRRRPRSGRVVVGPGRARQLEQPLALGEGRRASGSGSMNTCGGRRPPPAGCGATAACRCRTRRPTCRPTPTTVKSVALRVQAQLAEVAARFHAPRAVMPMPLWS